MDQSTLVGGQIAPLSSDILTAGQKLVTALDGSPATYEARPGFKREKRKLYAAFWAIADDTSRYQLFLVLSNADRAGPRVTYSWVQSVMKKERVAGLSISHIAILDKDDAKYRELAAPYRKELTNAWIIDHSARHEFSSSRAPIFAYRLSPAN